MNYQGYAFTRNFLKRLKWWYLILIVFCVGFFIYYKLLPNYEISRYDFLSSLGSINEIQDIQKINLLFLIYQIFVTIYSSISFNSYEKTNSPEYVMLRINYKKLFLIKLLILSFFIIFIRTIYFVLNYYLYNGLVEISIRNYFIPIFFHLIIGAGCSILKLFCFNLNYK